MHTTLTLDTKGVVIMGDAKLHWDEKLKRWRGMYRGTRLSISARKLGGTNATDTKVQANRWLKREKEQIDAKLGERTRPHEAAYRGELQNLQATEEQLRTFRHDPIVAPVLDIVQGKKREIENRLKMRALPPLVESLRNPLELSVREIEERAERRAHECVFAVTPGNINRIFQFIEYLKDDERDKYEQVYDDAELKSHLAFLICNPNSFAEPGFVFEEGVVDRILPADLSGEERRERMIDMIVKLEMFRKILMRVGCMELFGSIFREEMKEEIGTMQNDFERGILCQKLNSVELAVAVEKDIFIHLEHYIDFQKQRVQAGRIKVGELEQVMIRVRHYKSLSTRICG